LKTKLTIPSVPGDVIFPNHDSPVNHLFKMGSASMMACKERKPGVAGAPMIVGRIDYIFGTDPTHHQTRFIYEVDKPGPDRGFLAIEPTLGQVTANQIALAVNPLLAKDAD
jgi:hypothetical protein